MSADVVLHGHFSGFTCSLISILFDGIVSRGKRLAESTPTSYDRRGILG